MIAVSSGKLHAPRCADDGDSNANHCSSASFDGWYVRLCSGVAWVALADRISTTSPVSRLFWHSAAPVNGSTDSHHGVALLTNGSANSSEISWLCAVTSANPPPNRPSLM